LRYGAQVSNLDATICGIHWSIFVQQSFFAIADGFQPLRGDPANQQIAHDSLGAFLGKRQVVVGRARRIGMSGDFETVCGQ
jgi:hypothetical protein